MGLQGYRKCAREPTRASSSNSSPAKSTAYYPITEPEAVVIGDGVRPPVPRALRISVRLGTTHDREAKREQFAFPSAVGSHPLAGGEVGAAGS